MQVIGEPHRVRTTNTLAMNSLYNRSLKGCQQIALQVHVDLDDVRWPGQLSADLKRGVGEAPRLHGADLLGVHEVARSMKPKVALVGAGAQQETSRLSERERK